MAQPAYWPKDKSNFRSLDKLIYNPRTQTSWLLAVLRSEPVPLAIKQARDPTPNITALFKIKCREDVNEALIYNKLLSNITSLSERYKELVRSDQDGRFKSRFPILERFCNHYINWIENQSWIRSFTVALANPSSKIYNSFEDNIREDFELKL